MDSRSDLLNVEQAGKLIGVSGRQVRRYIAAGILPATTVGRTPIIRRADLDKVPKDRKPGPKSKRLNTAAQTKRKPAKRR